MPMDTTCRDSGLNVLLRMGKKTGSMYKSNWFYLKQITTQKSNKNVPVSKAYIKKKLHKRTNTDKSVAAELVVIH